MFAGADTIDGGFANPVFDAQAVFKAVMDAMARPGTIMPVKALASPPATLSTAAAAVALTLCDHDTPLWLDSQLAECAAVYSWLGFHTGAPLVDMPGQAAFALVASPARLPPLSHFGQGTQEYPDRSTTIVLQVDVLSSGHTKPEATGKLHLLLEGPGIQSTVTLLASPLPANFVVQWQENHARFPRGVDLIIAAPGALACLPRTVKIRES